MARTATTSGPRDPLGPALADKAAQIRAAYGPRIGWDELLLILQDRQYVPYPCEVRFDSTPLLPGEFATIVPAGPAARDGFFIYIHPGCLQEPDALPLVVLHQLAEISCGQPPTAEEAEFFGSQVLGLAPETCFRRLCEVARRVGGDQAA
jgi:hypothetical protein